LNFLKIDVFFISTAPHGKTAPEVWISGIKFFRFHIFFKTKVLIVCICFTNASMACEQKDLEDAKKIFLEKNEKSKFEKEMDF
jgi:hypothetical protein